MSGSNTPLYPLGVLSPSMPDDRDRSYPVPPEGVGATDSPLSVFLPTKEQTFQGKQNSCLPHTATQLMEDDIWLRGGIRTDLSIPFLYKAGRRIHGWQDKNVGMWFRDAIDVARRVGVPPSILMPYDQNDWVTEPSPEAYRAASRNRAAEFYSVPGAMSLMQALVNGNPVGICVNVNENFSRFGSSGIWDPPEGAKLGAHAYVIDGYDRSGEYAPTGDLWFLGKNWWEMNPDGTPWGISHPLIQKDNRFLEHAQGRVWIKGTTIDLRSTFDMFAVLRFPLEK